MKTIVEEILSVLTKHELKACEALEILDLAKEDINYSSRTNSLRAQQVSIRAYKDI
jgi:hypothetical protein